MGQPIILNPEMIVKDQRSSVSSKAPAWIKSTGLIHTLDPLSDRRWNTFLIQHPKASIFHTPEWLTALKKTYGYEPVVFTTSKPGEALQNGTVFCIVRSWLVSPRLVSLPFSDHVDPLLNSRSELLALVAELQFEQKSKSWTSIELRPQIDEEFASGWDLFHDGESYALHKIDLSPGIEQIFARFHRDSVQRRIRRAEREGLLYEEGRDERFLREFYRLTVMTRKRQFVPPPPIEWFRNLLQSVGENAKIRLATHKGQVIGSVFTLQFKQTAVYKYGCTDERFHNLGCMPFLFWKMIQDAKANGAMELDLGRSDVNNSGLITFKEKFGASRVDFTYKKFPGQRSLARGESLRVRVAKSVFRLLPGRALVVAGKLIYPHIG